MTTFNQIAYMIYDELGLSSDDERINIDHIFFLMKNYRSYILKQQYTNAKKNIPLSNYQTICIDIKYTNDCLRGSLVKSIQEIPDFVNLNSTNSVTINPIGDLFNNIEYALISEDRFRFVGNNKWLYKIIYFTVGTDKHLYLKSTNPNFKYLKKVEVNALFEDTVEAAKLSCNKEEGFCEYLDTKYPLEESLIPVLIELVVKELGSTIYKPEDNINNASDDLSGLGTTK